ncbi:hypothetical protein HK099_003902 [Clydaea vesicula]|uniref:Uncharacterized protein n=1 Tax=Clydaea vesicula TaxID=447962 RepID=A0AAD5XW10_9FUNG|nr:hypothetical protein HK099_003902 [Clydaea vesicula]
MIESVNIIPEDILLHDEDFPREYIDMAHPNDYKPVNNFENSFIINDRYGKHKRLIARIAWKTHNGNFIPMSFVCDTGAPSSFYLSSKAIEILEEYSLLKLDDKGVAYVTIHKDNSRSINNQTINNARIYTEFINSIIGLIEFLHDNIDSHERAVREWPDLRRNFIQNNISPNNANITQFINIIDGITINMDTDINTVISTLTIHLGNLIGTPVIQASSNELSSAQYAPFNG